MAEKVTKNIRQTSEKKQELSEHKQDERHQQERILKQKKRNLLIAYGLIFWVVLILLITLLKVKTGVFVRDL